MKLKPFPIFVAASWQSAAFLNLRVGGAQPRRRYAATVALALLSTLNSQLATFAQSTAFTYQGRLYESGSGASGIYDLRFTIYDALSSGTQQGAVLTNSPTAVSNGLFTVTLDFGNQFSGADRWLEIGVRTNGGGAFTTLTPRQQLTSTPYAVRALNAGSAASYTGAITDGQLSANIARLNGSNVFSGVVQFNNTTNNFAGTFTGNGSGVTNVLMTELNAPGILSWPGNYSLVSSPDVGNVPRSVVAADVNSDGKLDLISANSAANTLSVLTNNGSGVFGLAATYIAGNNTRSVTSADVNGDGKPDLICTSQGPGALIVLTNNGSGTFVAASTNTFVGGGGNVQMVVAADINGDGKPDLISANGNSPGTLFVFTNNGSGGFVAASTNSVGNNPFAVAVADVNGDTFPDLISANNIASGTLSVLLNNGSGGFLLAINYSAGNGPRSVAAADLNGDGYQDLICANNGDGTLSVLLNNGAGAFPLATPVIAGSVPVWVTAVDLNGDGKTDLICANNTTPGTLTAVTNNGSGVFSTAFTKSVGNSPFAVIAADVNADGRVDLVSANGVTPGTLSVLFNLPSFNGVFAGTLDANAIATGTIADARIDPTIARDSEILPTVLASDGVGSGLDADVLDGLDASAFWKTAGNSGTTAGTHFLGTTDNQALEFKVNGVRALRLELNTNGAPNVIGGSPLNFVAAGVFGATVGGGGATNYLGSAYTNRVTREFGTVGGGRGNTSSGIEATVGGGRANTSSDASATVGGGYGNTCSGTEATVGGGSFNSCSGIYATVGGGHNNFSSSTATTVAGGLQNVANIFYATVGGGTENSSIGSHATIGGGYQNTSGNESSTVGGGRYNMSSGLYSTVGGGYTNTSSGQYATVPGGYGNIAGDYSFAAGLYAKATNQGSFVWSDATGADLFSTNNQSWTARASGGVRFFSNAGATAGVFLAPNGTSWAAISDRNAKKNFQPVDVQAVLEKLAQVPVTQWNYQWESDTEVPHLGPMAQDFKGAFYPGRDDKSITTQEIDGVALAAIQGLNQKLEQRLEQKEAEITELKARLETLERLMRNGGAK